MNVDRNNLNIFNVTLINARSLLAKLKSFKNVMEQLSADVTVVTETWFKDDLATSDVLSDFEEKNGVGVIKRDRGGGTRGGGVAIFFDKSKIAVSRARLPHSKHEVVAAIGRRTGQRRKCLLIGVYLPPWYNAAQNASFYNYVNDCLTILLNRYDDPYVILAGDFNRRDLNRATGNFPQIKVVNPLPPPDAMPRWTS